MYTVVIPTFNSSERINKTLNSVFNQTIQPNVVFIIDDMSGDIEELRNIIYEMRNRKIILIESDVKRNAAYNRNIGWDKSSDPYVFFLDSDDEWLPEHAASTLDIFACDSNIGCVFSHFYCCTGNGAKGLHTPSTTQEFSLISDDKNPLDLLMSAGFDFRSSTIALKQEVFEKANFDSYLQKHQDWDLFISLVEKNILVARAAKASVILNEFGDYRMSSRNNINASIYFINKWRKFMNKENINRQIAILYSVALKRKSSSELKYISKLSNELNYKLNFRNRLISIFSECSTSLVIVLYLFLYRVKHFCSDDASS